MTEANQGVLRFRTEDASDLAAKLDQLLREPAFEKATRNATDFIVREFSPGAVAARTGALYGACSREFQNAG
jgi:hypothetical protein